MLVLHLQDLPQEIIMKIDQSLPEIENYLILTSQFLFERASKLFRQSRATMI